VETGIYLEIGVALIDTAVGGVTAGLPLVVEADQGAGRNALFLQMIGGALARGEQVVFLSADPPTLLLHQASAMQIDLESPLCDQRLLLLEMDPTAASQLRIHGPSALVDAIRETAPRATFLAINPLSTLTAEILDEPQLRSVVRAIHQDWENAHLVMGVETDLLEHSAGLRRILLSSCGAYVRAQRKYGPHCVLQIERLRVGNLPEAPIPFRLSQLGTQIEQPKEAAKVEEAAYVRPLPESAPAPPTQPVPAAEPSAPQTPGAPPASADDDERVRSVLIIDDDALAREMYSDWLKDRYRISTARDGSEGLAAFMSRRPDLILLDLEMPKVSGFEVLRALGGASDWTPVIVISGRIRRHLDRVRPFLLGASDVIRKPPERFDLVRRVDSLIRTDTRPPDLQEFAMLHKDDVDSAVLDEVQFRRRLDRATLIARRFDIASSLLSLEVAAPDELEHVVTVASDELRIEDGIFPLSQERALFLLVGAPVEGASAALARLCNALEKRGVALDHLQGQLFEVHPELDLGTWSDFFKDMVPWLSLRAQ
jgi:DNA-binding response OmpR family regulator/archaellum biogenesis ATPase FlaH